MNKVGIIGTTSWGTTLSIILANKGLCVALWARTAEEARALRARRENTRLLPGVPLPEAVEVTADLELVTDDAAVLILAVPSQTMRQNVATIRPYLQRDTILLSGAKGLEVSTTLRMSEVIASELGPNQGNPICVLSGPNLAREIATGRPATAVVASESISVAERVQDILITPMFRIYSHDDVIGVELGGTLKNIIAIGAGIGDGMGYGANAKAAFMTRGIAEITRLGVAAGANPLTFAGLAGLGDLLATCSSPLSRNRYVGEQLAKGRPLQEILNSMTHVAEGIPTTKAARQLAYQLGVEMPITEQTYRVLFEGEDLRHAMIELMLREAKHELEGIKV